MTEIRLPLSITYETEIPTSVADVIVALQAAEAISKDAVSLLPSLIDGLQVEQCSLNVHSLTEGSLREALFLALLFTYQADLAEEVPPMIEDLFKITVSDKYEDNGQRQVRHYCDSGLFGCAVLWRRPRN